MRGFAHIDCWIFDLDNTLYPASCRLFDQIDRRMGEFVSNLFGITVAEARTRQKDLFYRHGTTLRGLMKEHGLLPDGFLDYVHDIDYSPVQPDPSLDEALHRLSGRKLIFTSGTVPHARQVLARLGVTHHFGDIFDIVHADFAPKPQAPAYDAFFARHEVRPETAAMFEDIARNLEIPHARGMTTVLVTSPDNHDANLLNRRAYWQDAETTTLPPHVDHQTGDLAGFLLALTAERH